MAAVIKLQCLDACPLESVAVLVHTVLELGSVGGLGRNHPALANQRNFCLSCRLALALSLVSHLTCASFHSPCPALQCEEVQVHWDLFSLVSCVYVTKKGLCSVLRTKYRFCVVCGCMLGRIPNSLVLHEGVC